MSLTKKYSDILSFVDEYGGITIEIAKNLFYNTIYGYDSSRRALNSLTKGSYLKVTKDFITDKNLYYSHKPISSHKLTLLRFYSYIIALGGEILLFQREFKISNFISDGLIIYKYNDEIKIILVEIDINNKTKLDKYKAIYESDYFQDKFNCFPRVFIIDKDNRKQLHDDNIVFINMNFDFKGIEKNI